jgi:competence protein ComEC
MQKLQASIAETLATALSGVLLQERERWLLWLPVMMALGVLLYFALPTEPPRYAGLQMLLLASPLGWFTRKRLVLRVLMIGIAAMAVGFAAVQWQKAREGAGQPLTKPIFFTTLTARVAEVIDTEAGMKLVLENPVMEKSFRSPAHPLKKIRLNFRKRDMRLQTGQEIRVRAGLFPLPQPALPDGYDIARHFYFQGIGAVGYGILPVEILKPATRSDAAEQFVQMRQRLSRLIRAEIPDVAAGAIADSLITGEQTAIPKDIRQALSVAGIAHILSISGLHLSIIAAILFGSLRWFLVLIPAVALHFPIKKIAACGALAGAAIYLALAGFPVAANRSFVMVALVLGAVLLDRQVLSMRSVALAAIVILLWTPESLLGPSFQLSFAATIAIVACYESYRRHSQAGDWFVDRWLMKGWNYVGGIALTSLIAGLATTPFVILHFNQMTLYHILTNLLIAPLLSVVVMPAALLAVLLLPLNMAAPAFFLLEWGVKQIITIAVWVADLPFAVSFVPSFPLWGIALISFGGLWFCCWLGRWRWLGAPFFLMGLLSLATVRLPDVVIAPLASQIAIRNATDGGYAMVKGSTRNFTAGLWLKSLGIKEFSPLADNPALRCDGMGCTALLGDTSLAILLRRDATEDCSASEILIADFYLRCPTRPQRAILRPAAATAIWLTNQPKPIIKTASSYIMRLQP